MCKWCDYNQMISSRKGCFRDFPTSSIINFCVIRSFDTTPLPDNIGLAGKYVKYFLCYQKFQYNPFYWQPTDSCNAMTYTNFCMFDSLIILVIFIGVLPFLLVISNLIVLYLFLVSTDIATPPLFEILCLLNCLFADIHIIHSIFLPTTVSPFHCIVPNYCIAFPAAHQIFINKTGVRWHWR